MQTAIDLAAAQPRVLDIAAYAAQEERLAGVRIAPIEPILGARVTGLRLRAGERVPEPLAATLRRKLLERGFLVFEPGTVDAEAFVDLVSVFGDVQYSGGPYTPAPQDNRLVNTIDSSIKKTHMNYIWHVDGGYRHHSPKMTALFGHTVPEAGGDTLFANAVAAYDLLDPLFARYIETLTAVQSAESVGHLTLQYHDPDELARQRGLNPPIETPVIRVHPETGGKQVFVNESYTLRIKAVTRAVSQNLLNILFDLIKSPEIQVRFRWEQGAVLIWDNRTVQHRGVHDYSGRRVLYRAIVS
ncbi:TauD/TfdA family dioxygenase [Luteimonas sp. Y-2-2-4F]|nr:TauD/TfdA family dioxygenase [Luteimonas sp. Y-2-2-4F]MCD9032672.1 TauD/TfdA family dioxygenase [Luteimonas sp. Y-2-2-4F]